jgi:GTP cyclohydrolase II/3,4-dihydroxy 2-butanone 4-phosphate synthase/GTP cyclohydrolase II
MLTALKSSKLDLDWSASTILPIEFDGKELHLEAIAYQGADPACQAMALVHRPAVIKSLPSANNLNGNGHYPANGHVNGHALNGHANDELPIVRVHSGCVTGDIFHSLRCDCYAQLKASMERITNSPYGILIYLPYHEGRGIGLVNKIRAYALQDQGYDTVDANIEIGAPIDARDYQLAADILFDMKADKIRLLSNNPAKMEALMELGITVVERLPVVAEPTLYNKRYLETKRERMAHKI